MDINEQEKKQQELSWWIASIAMSTVICALFAGYMFDIKESLHSAMIREDILLQRVEILASEVSNLKHRVMIQQAQVVPSSEAAPAAPPPADALAPVIAPVPEVPAAARAVPAPQPTKP